MKIYLWIGSIAAVAIGLVAYTYFVYDAGRAAERARTAAEAEQQRQREAILIDELEKAKAHTRVVVKTKTKIIRTTPDPSNCTRTVIPGPILNVLR